MALFLAEAGARLDDDRLRATALGAIRLALDHADRIDPQVRDGLYSGRIGVAYAAARVAGLLGAEDVHARARELLVAWRRDGTRSGSSDLMSGCSGAVLGLVAAERAGRRSRGSSTRRRELGDELIARADAAPGRVVLGGPGQRSMHNLCGYAHGAAGIGHALAELFARDRRSPLPRGRAYGRSTTSDRGSTRAPERGRTSAASPAGPDATRRCRCPTRGATAPRDRVVADARGGAARIDGLRHEAGIALATCERYVAELLMRVPDDFSLCHGAAGAADVLLHGQAGPGGLARPARAVAGSSCYAGPEAARFPCGVPLGETPGLLLGLAAGSACSTCACSTASGAEPAAHPSPAVDSGSCRCLESDPPAKGARCEPANAFPRS